MKKILATLIICAMILSIMQPTTTYAYETETTVEYLENGDCIETIIITITSTAETRASSVTKKGTKTTNYKNSDGDVLWSISVTGTFTYVSGSSCTCTAVSGSAVSNSSSWKVSTAKTSKSSNKATASTTATKYLAFLKVDSIERSVTLTCDTYGNLS